MTGSDYRELWRLYDIRNDLKDALREGRLQQTVPTEVMLTELDFKIRALEGEQQAFVNREALTLFKSYKKGGCMRIAIPQPIIAVNRRIEDEPPPMPRIIEGTPHRTGNPIQDLWNVRSEAVSLAERYLRLRSES